MGCRKWPVFRGFAEEAIAGSAKVLAISQDNRDLALSVLPSCANKLLLLPNGYNEDIFYPEEVDRESLLTRWVCLTAGNTLYCLPENWRNSKVWIRCCGWHTVMSD